MFIRPINSQNVRLFSPLISVSSADSINRRVNTQRGGFHRAALCVVWCYVLVWFFLAVLLIYWNRYRCPSEIVKVFGSKDSVTYALITSSPLPSSYTTSSLSSPAGMLYPDSARYEIIYLWTAYTNGLGSRRICVNGSGGNLSGVISMHSHRRTHLLIFIISPLGRGKRAAYPH